MFLKSVSIKATLLAGLCIPALSLGAAHAKVAPLKGIIAGDTMWQSYKDRFVHKSGRVIDNGNKKISHSEGQGFSMLLALAADDPKTFERIWAFTREHMMVRKDNLVAWRWSPRGFVRVSDKNNATDGDLLIAWALLEAAEAGYAPHYRDQAHAILADMRKLVKRDGVFGLWMRPGAHGFDAKHNKGKDIINLSYWVFPALERVSAITGDPLWRDVAKSGEPLIAKASANKAGLPPDWSAMKRNRGKVDLARKFTTKFSYNAVRVPLYLAWSEKDRRASLGRFQSNWIGRSGQLAQVDVRRDRVKGAFAERGYYAIAAVVNCSLSGEPFPTVLRSNLDKLYYPASLHLLSIVATKQRYPQCW